MGIVGVTIWVIGLINLLTKSPDPPTTLENVVVSTSFPFYCLQYPHRILTLDPKFRLTLAMSLLWFRV